MKIMTFNIQHCNYFPEGRIDFLPFRDAVLSSDAHIIGLNEVRGKGLIKGYTDQIKKLSSLTGYKGYFGKAISVKGLAPYGNGLLTKLPLISAETVKIPDPKEKTGTESYETRCIIKAVIGENEKYTVLITHFGLNGDERENAVKALLSLAKNERCIIMGDFNCTPDNKVLAPLFERFNCSDTEDFTFPSDKPVKKIDYIFTSPDIEVINKGTVTDVVSDHLAQWIEIKEK